MGLFGKALVQKDLIEIYRLYKTLTSGDYLTSGDDTQYYVDVNRDEKKIVIVFQGSHSTTDWLNDFNGIEKTFTVLDGKEIKGHSGFYNAYYSAKAAIRASVEIATGENPEYELYFLGHSLGAAIAEIAALDHYQETGNKVKVITYGTPKVFSDDSIEAVRQTIKAFAEVDRTNDMVTWFTPWYSQNLAGHKDYRIGKFNVLHYANVATYHNTYQDISLYDDKPEVVRNRLSEMAKDL